MLPPVTLAEITDAIRTLEAAGQNCTLRAILAEVTSKTGKRPSLGTITTLRKQVLPAVAVVKTDDPLTQALAGLAPQVRARAMEEASLAVAAQLEELRRQVATLSDDLQAVTTRLVESDERLSLMQIRAEHAEAAQQSQTLRVADLTSLVDRMTAERDVLHRQQLQTISDNHERIAHVSAQLAGCEAAARTAAEASAAAITDLTARLAAADTESRALREHLQVETIRSGQAESAHAEVTRQLGRTQGELVQQSDLLAKMKELLQQSEMALHDAEARASNTATHLDSLSRELALSQKNSDLLRAVGSQQEPIARIEELLQIVSSTVKVIEVSIRHRPPGPSRDQGQG